MSANAGTRKVSTAGERALRAPFRLDDHAAASEIEVSFRPALLQAFAGVVTLRGEHDVATTSELDQVLASIEGDILVDLTACSFIDSSVIGVLIGAVRALARDGHRLELVIPEANTAVSRIADVVGLRTFVSVVERLPVDEIALWARGSRPTPR